MGELFDKLTEYAKTDAYPFHMPGHKRNLNEKVYSTDITEIDGFDDLHKPEAILLNLKNRIAKIYGADDAYILLNGSTSGIQVAISGIAEYGEHILVARNSHKAVYNSVMLRGMKISYVYPQIDAETGINKSVLAEDVEKKLETNPDIKAVVITSPTYEGVTSDIKGIAEVVHKYNIPLIVDAAHGAHFGFSEIFPENPIRLGADIVIMSVHKTLPALTQTAIMCLNGDRVDRNKIERYFHVFLSSSPSYVLMSSIDKCMDYLEQSNNLFLEYEENLQGFYGDCRLENLRLIRTNDPAKIVIFTGKTNINGEKLKRILREKYLLEMEMSSKDYVIAMTSIMDTKEGFNRLISALQEIDKELIKADRELTYKSIIPNQKIKLYDAEIANKKHMKLAECCGQISGDFIFAYPPGIPIITPGEIFDKNIIECIKENQANNINIYGINDQDEVSICEICEVVDR